MAYTGKLLPKGEVPPERETLSRLQVYKRVRILQVEVYERVGKGKEISHFRCLKGLCINIFRTDAACGNLVPRAFP